MRDCRKATQVIDKLLSSIGLTRHPTKEEWVGGTRVEHLGCVMDSDRMRFYIAPRKIAKVHGIARAILRQARQGQCGFRGTGYDRSVVCASHCRWQFPFLASTPGAYLTT
jgi:hypothetical protein